MLVSVLRELTWCKHYLLPPFLFSVQMLPLFTMLFLMPHHRPPRNWELPFQAICVWASTFELVLCFTTSILMFQVVPLNLGRNPKQSISLLCTVFFMDSQFSRHFSRLHLLCRILLLTFSLVKRNMILMDPADFSFIFKTSLETICIQQLPWGLCPPFFTCYYHIILFFYSLHFLCISMFSNGNFFPIFNSLTMFIFTLQIKNVYVFVNALHFHLFFSVWWSLMCFFFF